MSKSDFDYNKELERFCKSRGIWNKEKKKPTKFVINRIKNITKIHPDGYTYQQGVFDGFTIKRTKLANCRICFKKLKGKQRKYCSESCRISAIQLRQEFTKLNNKNKNIAAIIWNPDPDGKPQRKNIKGIIHKNGKFHHEQTNIITKKSGKLRNKILKEFSSGKNH